MVDLYSRNDGKYKIKVLGEGGTVSLVLVDEDGTEQYEILSIDGNGLTIYGGLALDDKSIPFPLEADGIGMGHIKIDSHPGI